MLLEQMLLEQMLLERMLLEKITFKNAFVAMDSNQVGLFLIFNLLPNDYINRKKKKFRKSFKLTFKSNHKDFTRECYEHLKLKIRKSTVAASIPKLFCTS